VRHLVEGLLERGDSVCVDALVFAESFDQPLGVPCQPAAIWASLRMLGADFIGFDGRS
jgi:hypothetical protein